MAYWDSVIKELEEIMSRLDRVQEKMGSSGVGPDQRKKLWAAHAEVRSARNDLVVDTYENEGRRPA